MKTLTGLDVVLFKKLDRDSAFHIRDLGLQALFADLGKMPGLIDHATSQATHADRARLARVVRRHAAREPDDAARLARLRERVADRRQSAPGARLLRHAVLFLGCGPSTVRIAPPLIVTKDEADTAIEVLDECITIAEQQSPKSAGSGKPQGA